jgi:hypothetical protein
MLARGEFHRASGAGCHFMPQLNSYWIQRGKDLTGPRERDVRSATTGGAGGVKIPRGWLD